MEDQKYAILAIIFIVVYCFLLLGACSPIHCKVSLAVVGFVCIALSILAGADLAISRGYLESDVHQTMPVLMLGIGVDDMFVMCNAID